MVNITCELVIMSKSSWLDFKKHHQMFEVYLNRCQQRMDFADMNSDLKIRVWPCHYVRVHELSIFKDTQDSMFAD